MVTIIACMFKKWLLRIINASLTTAIALKVVLYLFRVSKRFKRTFVTFFFSTTTTFIAVKKYVICAMRQNGLMSSALDVVNSGR